MTLSVLWITGARGLIGSYLLRQATLVWPGSRTISVGHPEVELTDHRALESQFAADRPDAVIHCAALSRSPVCEADPLRARRQNVEVTRHLAELCSAIPLVLFSTDLVFDGRRGAYREEDEPNPLLVYGATKLEAEQIVRANPRNLIIRTSLNYGHSSQGNRSFNEEMLQAWQAGKTLKLFGDEFRSPIAASETAAAVLELLKAGASGLFHMAGQERLSRWQLGQLLATRHPEANPKLEASSLHEFAGPPRPADVTLNSAKAEAVLGRPLPRFSAWLNSQPIHTAS